ncbi:IS110 family transposase (plasmid) [Bernardetia sp. Wsw4-3y2]|uniref:IS110 family transposase n=1 Tax=unclassified Bernardetia TaxID=2647129 RepID=UPI0030D14FE8
MQTYQTFLGIDVSRNHLDCTLLKDGVIVSQKQIKNNLASIESYLAKLETQIDISFLLVCLEPTGVYINFLLTALLDKKMNVWVENALQIKQSMGFTREKNDKEDAYRIALYAFRFQDRCKLYTPVSQSIKTLKTLQLVRKNLIKCKKQLETFWKESQKFETEQQNEYLTEHLQKPVEQIKEQIIAVEKSMKNVIRNDEKLKELYRLTTSVVGVGDVTAIKLLVVTQGFTKFKSAKQLACYAGVVPFEKSSGNHKGKPRVSKIADKSLKTLLHMCALAAIKVKGGELSEFYERKIKEGKNKMSVLNALRNKILQRVVACVQNNKIYERQGVGFQNAA